MMRATQLLLLLLLSTLPRSLLSARYVGRDPWVVERLPAHLVACYSDPRLLDRDERVPQTMANLIDLIQRLERDPGFVVDLRVLLTTVLHRFRVDGVERNPIVTASPGVTPYRLTGTQHARHRVLMGSMLSGNPNLFPNASLSVQQQCALHLMLSPSVDPWERGDEHWICPRMPTPRRAHVPLGTVFWPAHRQYPDPGRDVGLWGGVNVSPPPPAERTSNVWSACPVEEGVVEAGPAGRGGLSGVAAGTVLAGLAAGLQHQEVPLSALLSPRHLQRLRADGGSDADTVDNLWAATLAGDLAEVAAYQGPFANGVLALGPAGVWNDTVLPRVRYLARERPGSPEHAPVEHWDMTDAEIRGGFDGLALGSRVAKWTERTGRLRLSQILDMYYSAKGVAYEPDVRACRRGVAVSSASASSVFTPDTLFAQTSRFARTLTDSSPDAPYMTEAVLRNFTASSVRVFLRYAADLLNADACDTPPLMDVRVNALVVLDTTWDRKPAFKFITLLASGIEVGLFGSRIAVMDGGVRSSAQGPVGGHWIANFTDSPVQLATDWMAAARAAEEADELWPTYLDLPWSLMAVIEYLRSKSEAESSRSAVGSVHGDVVVIVAASSTVSDTDMRQAKTLVPKIKEASPDTRLLYVVTEVGEERFKELVVLNKDWDDAVVVVGDTSPSTVSHAVTNYLREMAGRLVPPECMLVQSESRSAHGAHGAHSAESPLWPVQRGDHVWSAPGVRRRGERTGWSSRSVLEDYVSPGQLRLYRIHSSYLRPGVPVRISVIGEDYGDLRMCMWRGSPPGGPLAAMRAALRVEEGEEPPRDDDAPQAECANVAGSGEANVTIAEPCLEQCAPLYVSVASSKSFFKCTEEDCRYPDQVRFLLRPHGLFCTADFLTAAGGTPATPWVMSSRTALALLLFHPLLVALRIG